MRVRMMTRAYEAMSLARRLANTLGCLLVDQLVPDPPNRLNSTGARGELLAKPGDVDVDRPRVAQVVEPPDEVEQPLAIQDQAQVLDKRQEQIELLGAQSDLLPRDRDLSPRRVDLQVSHGGRLRRS